jgi:DNA-binding GntR family transcriptional regulator
MSRPRATAPTDPATAPPVAVRRRVKADAEAPLVPHASRPDQVYARLRELIVQGQLAPGSRIVETEVASRLGVSRTPVREALQRLQQEGYVLGSPHAQQSRLTVAPLTRVDVYELLNIVGAIEGLAARGAAEQDPSKRRMLAKALRATNADFQRIARATPVDHGRLYETDEHFHRAIVELGAGPRLLALHDAVKPQAERYIRMYITLLLDDIRSSVDEHQLIVTAIENGDADGAEHSVETNWRHAAERLSKVIEVAGERGSW